MTNLNILNNDGGILTLQHSFWQAFISNESRGADCYSLGCARNLSRSVVMVGTFAM
jgi:hypothetical protein